MKLYTNGMLAASSTIGAHAIATSASTLRIGSDNDNHLYFDGLIDEATVYNRGLSASEILAIYNAGSNGKCPSPPVILTQPQSLTVTVGANATFCSSLVFGQRAHWGTEWLFGHDEFGYRATRCHSLTLTNVRN